MKTDEWRPPAWLPAAAYLVLTLAWTWPLPLHLTNRFTHDPGDPLLVTYLIWWNAHAIPFTQAWWNAPFFWPLPNALALTEHLAGLSPLTTPVQWLGGSPLLAYNVVLIASTWWTLLAMHLLCLRLTGSGTAAAFGAVAFAFAPYRTAQLGHLQLYACWWIPLAVLSAHAFLEGGRRRWLIVFGASWLLQALTNGYSLFHLPLLFAGIVAYFTRWREHPSRAIALGITWLAGALLLLPVLWRYHQVQTALGLSRGRSEMIFYSADWRALLSATPNLLFWKTPAPSTTEAYLFPGLTVTVLVLIAASCRLRDRVFRFYLACAVAAALLCLGPSAAGLSMASLTHPYDLLLWLPGFSGIRVPPRFFMITAFSLAIAAAVAVARLLPRRHPALVVLVFIGLAVDGLIAGMPLGVPPGQLPPVDRNAPLLSLPFGDSSVSIPSLYRSMAQRLPVVNGYAGYVPPHASVIEWALARRDPSILTELRRGHPLYVAIANHLEAPQWTAFIEAQNDAKLLSVGGGGRLYVLPPAPYPRQIAVGAAIAPLRTQATAEWLVADLGRVTTLRAVDLRTRGHVVLLRQTVRVETSVDGVTWTMAADELSGGLAYIGVLVHPRLVPLRLVVPDVQARYVRINAPVFGPSAITIYGS